MAHITIHTIDLHFQGVSGTIAAYAVPYADGVVLIECGPASTLQALREGLAEHGIRLGDITDLLVTHIHLDHAGAVGWIAREGARVHVHHVGAPHLIDPEKLLASAGRIYGDQMNDLWGEFLAVPAKQVVPLKDGDEIFLGDLSIKAVDTPGHASHHHAYLLDEVCFSGDVGGIRLPRHPHLELPMPPPDLHLTRWLESVDRLIELGIDVIAPTHFGVYPGATAHLNEVKSALLEVDRWLVETMRDTPPQDEFLKRYIARIEGRARKRGEVPAAMEDVETVNPSYMSALGLHRYWQKHKKSA